MKVKKFHQFVVLERGPINTAIVDLLKGNVYQSENHIVDKFLAGEYREISTFIQMLEEEELCFNVHPEDWIPYITFDEIKDDSFYVQIEEEIDIEKTRHLFSDYTITISACNPDELDFNHCLKLVKCDGGFQRIDENDYHFNRYYNSCWGKKIAVLKDGTAKPCIHSHIVLGNIFTDDVGMIVDNAREYWTLIKDKVEKCKDCELRYVCFDCREIAFRDNGNLVAANPYCKYDPYKGAWSEGDK